MQQPPPQYNAITLIISILQSCSGQLNSLGISHWIYRPVHVLNNVSAIRAKVIGMDVSHFFRTLHDTWYVWNDTVW